MRPSRWPTRPACLTCLACLTCHPLAAQTVNFAIPESPAFTFLGVNPTKVARPGSTRDLGVALLSAIDSTGRMLQGFAADFTLWTVIPGFDLPLSTVQSSWPHYVLSTAQISLATARAQSDTASTDIALGLRLTLLDQGDPMLDNEFTRALGTALLRCAPSQPGLGGRAEQEACLHRARGELAQLWQRRHWNEPRISVGLGTGVRAVNSLLRNREWLGWSAWGAGAIPVASLQILLHVQYDQRESVGGTPASQALSYGTRALLGSGTVAGYLELLGTRLFAVSAGTERGTASWSGGIEFEAAENLWLSTGFGSRFATETQEDKIVIIAGIRWAISDAARYQ